MSVIDATLSKKYRFAFLNSAFLFFIRQASGQSVTLVLAKDVIEDMKKAGKFNISISLALNVLNFLSTVFAFNGGIMA